MAAARCVLVYFLELRARALCWSRQSISRARGPSSNELAFVLGGCKKLVRAGHRGRRKRVSYFEIDSYGCITLRASLVSGVESTGHVLGQAITYLGLEVLLPTSRPSCSGAARSGLIQVIAGGRHMSKSFRDRFLWLPFMPGIARSGFDAGHRGRHTQE